MDMHAESNTCIDMYIVVILAAAVEVASAVVSTKGVVVTLILGDHKVPECSFPQDLLSSNC